MPLLQGMARNHSTLFPSADPLCSLCKSLSFFGVFGVFGGSRVLSLNIRKAFFDQPTGLVVVHLVDAADATGEFIEDLLLNPAA